MRKQKYGLQSGQPYTIEESASEIFHGTKETVREALLNIQERYQVEELILSVSVKVFRKRLRSYELLHSAFVSDLAIRYNIVVAPNMMD